MLITPAKNSITGDAVVFHNSTAPNPVSLSNFTALKTSMNSAHVRDYSDFQKETTSFGDRSLRESFFTTSIKATPDAVRTINETITSAAMELRDVADLLVSPIFQPVSVEWLEAAIAAGGDALDLNPEDGNFIIIDVSCHWSSSDSDTLITSFSRSVLETIDAKAKTAGLYYPIIFLNDAGPGESPFSTYGRGKSISRMKDVRRRYDADGIFQTLMPGGFKLGT